MIRQTCMILIIIIVSILNSKAVEVKITITTLPDNHPWDEPIYIAGDFNNWNPGNESHKLTKNNDNTYSITINNSGTIKFKFTRGSWEKVEKGINCAELSNRSFTFGATSTLNLQIINWADKCGNPHTAQENVSILSDSFYIPQLNRFRRIWIYLPKDYNNSQSRYPVLYMHDGQNLFDNNTAFAGEWGIDESLNSMTLQGNQSCIAVGIDNGGNNRINEYSPWINSSYGGGEGEKYMKFIVETLKPHIDSIFRTLPDRENTGIMGSSMGGLISFYGGLKYQEIFSKIGIFSPSFWFSQDCFSFAEQNSKKANMKLYFLAGGQESGVSESCKNIIKALKKAGYSDEEIKLKEVPSGQHNESFWKQEFPAAYQWLFPKPLIIKDLKSEKLNIFPNPVTEMIIVAHGNIKTDYAEIYNSFGILELAIKLTNSETQIDVKNLKSGLYYIRLKDGVKTYAAKFLKK